MDVSGIWNLQGCKQNGKITLDPSGQLWPPAGTLLTSEGIFSRLMPLKGGGSLFILDLAYFLQENYFEGPNFFFGKRWTREIKPKCEKRLCPQGAWELYQMIQNDENVSEG